jgi:peptide/nickel transport system ATP-binding protein
MCDRIYVLYAGTLLEVSPALDLERMPLHPYTHGLLESEPPLEARLSRLHAIPGSVPVASDVIDRCAFSARCSWAKPVCVASHPVLAAVGAGRLSACVRIDEIRDELRVSPRAGDSDAVGSDRRAGEVLIRVVDLVKHFGHANSVTRALERVSLTVRERDSIGIVGESGSGKTTLARCIVGLEQATAGTIEIAGADVTSRDRQASRAATIRHTVQMVFQDPYSTLNPSRSVGSPCARPSATQRSLPPATTARWGSYSSVSVSRRASPPASRCPCRVVSASGSPSRARLRCSPAC